jgi:hypothetical protein
MKTRECYGCKGIYPERPDLEAYATYGVGRYGVAIPECMFAVSEILVKENELYGYPQPAHRLIVDAVGLQHPPHRDIQEKRGIESRFIDASIQSVWIHGLGLYCIFVKKMSAKQAGLAMKKTLDTMNRLGHTFSELKPPYDFGKIKALDVQNAVMEKELSLEEYTQLANQWAQSVWDAWKDQHAAFAELYEKYCGTE